MKNRFARSIVWITMGALLSETSGFAAFTQNFPPPSTSSPNSRFNFETEALSAKAIAATHYILQRARGSNAVLQKNAGEQSRTSTLAALQHLTTTDVYGWREQFNAGLIPVDGYVGALTRAVIAASDTAVRFLAQTLLREYRGRTSEIVAMAGPKAGAQSNLVVHPTYTVNPKALFGESVYEWLAMHQKNGSTEDRLRAAETMAYDPKFWEKVDQNPGDFGLAIIRYAVENKLYLGTKSLLMFMGTLVEIIPPQPHGALITMSIPAYLNFRLALLDRRIQTYLDSDRYQRLQPEDRLVDLVDEMMNLDLLPETGNPSYVYTALPARLSTKAFKRDIQKIDASLKVYQQVRTGLKHPEVQHFLDTEFALIEREDRLPELVNFIVLKLRLPLDTDSFSQIYTALPHRLSAKVLKEDVYKMDLSLAAFREIREGIQDPAIQEYLISEGFGRLAREDRLVALVDEMAKRGLLSDPEPLHQMYTALPTELSSRFRELRDAVPDHSIQQFLKSEEFGRLMRGGRSAALVDKITQVYGLSDSDPLPQIYIPLLSELFSSVPKSSLQDVQTTRSIYKKMRAAFEMESIVQYLESPEFELTEYEDRFPDLMERIWKLVPDLDNYSFGQLFSTLPRLLGISRAKGDFQRVEGSLLIFRQIREAILNPKIQAFLDSDDFGHLEREDALSALVHEILDLKLPFACESLKTVYAALQPQLSAKVSKRSIQKVDVSMRLFRQVRDAIDHPSIQRYLDSKEFEKLEPGDRLVELYLKIAQLGLPLDTDDLREIHTALPLQLSAKISKRMIRQNRTSVRGVLRLRELLTAPDVLQFMETHFEEGIYGFRLAERLIAHFASFKGFPAHLVASVFQPDVKHRHRMHLRSLNRNPSITATHLMPGASQTQRQFGQRIHIAFNLNLGRSDMSPHSLVEDVQLQGLVRYSMEGRWSGTEKRPDLIVQGLRSVGVDPEGHFAMLGYFNAPMLTGAVEFKVHLLLDGMDIWVETSEGGNARVEVLDPAKNRFRGFLEDSRILWAGHPVFETDTVPVQGMFRRRIQLSVSLVNKEFTLEQVVTRFGVGVRIMVEGSDQVMYRLQNVKSIGQDAERNYVLTGFLPRESEGKTLKRIVVRSEFTADQAEADLTPKEFEELQKFSTLPDTGSQGLLSAFILPMGLLGGGSLEHFDPWRLALSMAMVAATHFLMNPPRRLREFQQSA